jgi:hypothetical protein
MSLRFTPDHRDAYSVVRVEGEPSLDEFLSFLQLMGSETAGWPTRRLMFDFRGVRTLKTFTDHYTVGEETARRLRHLDRIASVVPADRMTRASEAKAQQAGVNVRVFTSEADAIQWLTG